MPTKSLSLKTAASRGGSVSALVGHVYIRIPLGSQRALDQSLLARGALRAPCGKTCTAALYQEFQEAPRTPTVAAERADHRPAEAKTFIPLWGRRGGRTARPERASDARPPRSDSPAAAPRGLPAAARPAADWRRLTGRWQRRRGGVRRSGSRGEHLKLQYAARRRVRAGTDSELEWQPGKLGDVS